MIWLGLSRNNIRLKQILFSDLGFKVEKIVALFFSAFQACFESFLYQSESYRLLCGHNAFQ